MCKSNDRRRFGGEIQGVEEGSELSIPCLEVLWGRHSSPFPVVRKSTSGGVCGPGLSVFCYFIATLVDTHYGWLPRVECYRLIRLPGLAGESSSAGCRERLSEKGAKRCRVTNRRQPAGQEQAISSHFVCSRGTVLVSIETFQTVSEFHFSETELPERDIPGNPHTRPVDDGPKSAGCLYR